MARRVDSVAAVPPTEWDALDGVTLYQSHRWLRWLELEPGVTTTYLLAERDGPVGRPPRLVGVLPCFEVHDESNDAYAPATYRRQLGLEGNWLLVGTRRAYRSGLPLHPRLGPAAREVVAAELIEAALDHCRDRRLDGIVSLYTPATMVEALRRHGGSAFSDVDEAEIVTDGRSLDAYVAELPAHRRHRARREFARFTAADYVVDVVPLGEVVQEVAPLLQQVQQKYGHQDAVAELQEYLAGIASTSEDWIVFTVRRGRRLVACSAMCVFRGTLYARLVGFDYPALSNVFEYASVAFYLPIEWMSHHGVGRIHLGIDAAEAKVLRGATTAPLWTVAVPVPATT